MGRHISVIDEQEMGREKRKSFIQQKLREERKLEAESNVQHILEALSEGFGRVDRDWRIIALEASAERFGPVSKEQRLGRVLWEVYPSLVGTVVEQAHREVMQRRRPASCEFFDRETQQWVEFHLYPAEDGGILAFFQDVTEHKRLLEEREALLRAERAARMEAQAASLRSEKLAKELELQQALLQAIMEQAPCGVVIADAPGGHVLLTSQHYQNLFGSGDKQDQGSSDGLPDTAIQRERMRASPQTAALGRALATGAITRQQEVLGLRKDGQPVPVEVNAAPIRDRGGQIRAGIATFHDISLRYEMERRKDAFLCMANHELRTPFTALLGHLQLLDRRLSRLSASENGTGSLAPKVEIEQIARCAGRALGLARVEGRLLNDLMDAIAIGSERLQVGVSPCDLVPLVCETLDELRASTGTHRLEMEWPKQSEIAVLVDQTRIGQVVRHYVTNALKYSADTQPVSVGIELTQGEARVWVKDQGPGLLREEQHQIWDRFSPLVDFSAYSSRGGGGLGLGLYISRAVIQQHGGRVGVESAPGEGSTFWFTLPSDTDGHNQ